MKPSPIVYALVDPRTALPRYIGKSVHGIERARSHEEPGRVRTDSNRHKARWIGQLLAAGLRPDVLVLEEGADDREIIEGECAWIAFGRAVGWPLTNLTDGGDGAAGYVPSAESLARMSASQKRRGPRSAEACARMSAGRRGKPNPHNAARNRDPAIIAKRVATMTGRPRPDVALRNIGNRYGCRVRPQSDRDAITIGKLHKFRNLPRWRFNLA